MTVSRPGSLYLLGSSHGGAVAEVVRRIDEGRRGEQLRVGVSFAALPSVDGASQTRGLAGSLFPRAQVERFAVAGESDADDAEAARVIERADVLFFGGGDPVLAARRLVRAGADAWVRAARRAGAACVGLSAGSIVLGAWWGEWRETDPDPDPELVRCVGAAPRLVVDCHAEADDWEELQLVQRRLGAEGDAMTFAGIGHGSALVVGPDDALSWVGKARTLGAEPSRAR